MGWLWRGGTTPCFAAERPFNFSRRLIFGVAPLAFALVFVMQVRVASIFQFSYTDPSGNAADGIVLATDNLNGTFTAVSGTLHITASTTPSAVGSYTLVSGSGNSPSGRFSYNSRITFPGDPWLDGSGLLFSAGLNVEVNIWGNSPGNYSIYTWEAGLGYRLQYTGTATNSLVATNAGPFAKLQLLMPGESAAPCSLSGKTGTLTARRWVRPSR